MGRLARELAWCVGRVAIWLSPPVLTASFDFWQIDHVQRSAITTTYGEGAYQAGLRVTRHGKLTDGREADPVARAAVMGRSAVPTILMFFGSGLLADLVLRRYFGGGYRGSEPLLAWPFRSRAARQAEPGAAADGGA